MPSGVFRFPDGHIVYDTTSLNRISIAVLNYSYIIIYCIIKLRFDRVTRCDYHYYYYYCIVRIRQNFKKLLFFALSSSICGFVYSPDVFPVVLMRVTLPSTTSHPPRILTAGILTRVVLRQLGPQRKTYSTRLRFMVRVRVIYSYVIFPPIKPTGTSVNLIIVELF